MNSNELKSLVKNKNNKTKGFRIWAFHTPKLNLSISNSNCFGDGNQRRRSRCSSFVETINQCFSKVKRCCIL